MKEKYISILKLYPDFIAEIDAFFKYLNPYYSAYHTEEMTKRSNFFKLIGNYIHANDLYGDLDIKKLKLDILRFLKENEIESHEEMTGSILTLFELVVLK